VNTQYEPGARRARTRWLLPLILALAGCAGARPVPPPDDAGKMQQIHQEFDQERYADVVLLVDAFLSERPGTRYVEEATYMKGRALYERGMDIEAEDQFRSLLRNFPGGEFAPEATYYLALTLLSQSRQAQLDQTETRQALTQFRSFLNQYPDHELADRARTHVEEIRNKLAKKEYLNAKFYLHRGYQKAARIYFKEKVLASYDDTPWAVPAMLGLAKSYEETGTWKEAADWAQRVLDRAPASDEAGEAREILKKAAAQGVTPESPPLSGGAAPSGSP